MWTLWTVWTVWMVWMVCLVPTTSEALCTPDDGYKVRLSIKTALGDDAYQWNESEMFFFRATLAFAMRSYDGSEQYDVSNILVCDETVRVSFVFVVTKPSNTAELVPKAEVENAIKKSRHRINSAFLLTDQTLDFVGIDPTLAAPIQYDTPPWLIAFGVVMGLVCAGIVALLVSTFIKKTRSKKPLAESADEEGAGRGNGILCESIRGKDGLFNRGFVDDDRLTKL
ncbi:collectrin [Colossoma macropomum]|uniref:collectrin n=1 Tax=Colossoma macropomum TaxID=42526 RepID=UPI0018648E8A|nr:collectrin [Colossoma macropomum]